VTRSIAGNSPGSVGNRVHCQRCGEHGAVLAERLDTNLRPVTALLCTPCRAKHGYRDVKFDRSPPSTWGTATL
jgi:hypothetical protein